MPGNAGFTLRLISRYGSPVNTLTSNYKCWPCHQVHIRRRFRYMRCLITDEIYASGLKAIIIYIHFTLFSMRLQRIMSLFIVLPSVIDIFTVVVSRNALSSPSPICLIKQFQTASPACIIYIAGHILFTLRSLYSADDIDCWFSNYHFYRL